MSLELPSIWGSVDRHKAKLAEEHHDRVAQRKLAAAAVDADDDEKGVQNVHDIEILRRQQRKDTEQKNIKRILGNAQAQHQRRAKTDPDKIFGESDGIGDNEGRSRDDIHSRSSTVLALAGSFQSLAVVPAGGRSDELNNSSPSRPAKHREAQSKAKMGDAKEVHNFMKEREKLTEKGKYPKLMPMQKHSTPLSPSDQLTTSGQILGTKNQAGKPPLPSQIDKFNATGASSTTRRSLSPLPPIMEGTDSSAIGIDVNSAAAARPVVERSLSPEDFSPNSTMDRPDPANVPRIIPSAGGMLEGTMTSVASGTLGLSQDGTAGSRALMRLPGKDGPVISLTTDVDVNSVATRGARKGPVKCLYGKKAERKLAHPLQEERPFFDVWPANNPKLNLTNATSASTMGGTFANQDSVFVKPQLLNELEDGIRARLQKLSKKFPDFAAMNPVNPPSDVHLSPRNWRSAMRSGKPRGDVDEINASQKKKQSSAVVPSQDTLMTLDFQSYCSEEDRFRGERVKIFSGAVREFADQFKSYRSLLLWFANEFDQFMLYCHQNVLSPDARAEFKKAAIAAAEKQVAGGTALIQARFESAQAQLAELQDKHEKLKLSSSSAAKQIQDRDYLIQLKDEELTESAKGRAALLSRIERLEKEIWNQKGLLEGPERRCQELQKELAEAENKIKRGLETIDELAKDRALLRIRVEKLEDAKMGRGGGLNSSSGPGDGSRTAGAGGQSIVPAAQAAIAMQQGDLLQFKKREMDLLEHLAVYKAAVDRSHAKVAELNKVIQDMRIEKGTYTPRPDWKQFEDLLPKAPSSAKRVVCAAVEMNTLIEAKEAALDQLNDFKDLLGALPRNLTDATVGESHNGSNDIQCDQVDNIVLDMKATHFMKLGLEQRVPTYLKGLGFVPSIRLKRTTVLGFCKLLWVERETNSKSTVPVEQFVSRFCSKFNPEGVEPDVFAYNLHHAMHWYAFDPAISFTKDYITGKLDEMTFYSMQSSIRQLKDRLIKEAMHPGILGDPDVDDHVAGTKPGAATVETPGDGDEDPSQTPDIFPKTTVITALMDVMTNKSEAEIKSFILAVSRDCPGKNCSISALFGFNASERCFSNFLEEWYLQYFEERRTMITALTNQLFSVNTDDNYEAAPPDVAELFWKIDPDAPVQYMDTLIAHCFNTTVEGLFPAVRTESDVKHQGCEGERVYQCEDTILMDLNTIIRQLRSFPVRRFTKPPEPTGKRKKSKDDDEKEEEEE